MRRHGPVYGREFAVCGYDHGRRPVVRGANAVRSVQRLRIGDVVRLDTSASVPTSQAGSRITVGRRSVNDSVTFHIQQPSTSKGAVQ